MLMYNMYVKCMLKMENFSHQKRMNVCIAWYNEEKDIMQMLCAFEAGE